MVRNLPLHGWQPSVLTVRSSAYEPGEVAASADIPAGLQVHRALALDARRHLSVRGRYFSRLALPDRWASWLAGAVPVGLTQIRKQRIDLLWTTYPIASAHLIGWALHRLTGIPWVADFRDPMLEEIDGQHYPEDPVLRDARLSVERKVAGFAQAATFCTRWSRDIFTSRHAWGSDRPALVIENGFEAAVFDAAEQEFQTSTTASPGGLHLVHSGTLYPGPDRDPSGLFRAIAALRASSGLPPGFCVTLRATGYDAEYAPQIASLGLQDVVRLAPALGYREALMEMLAADGLLLFQGRTSNPAIPAKAYEYLRARRPILAMVDGEGETAALLARVRAGLTVPINDDGQIAAGLARFIDPGTRAAIPVLDESSVQLLAREARVGEFATLFDSLVPG